MNSVIACDEDLVRRLPLPLARLYRHATNANTPLDRHQASFFLWEASLKLLGSVAIVTYAERCEHDPALNDQLAKLARPALGHWWEFVRLLSAKLAQSGDAGFAAVCEFVLGTTARHDLPRTAGLDAALRHELERASSSRGTVRIAELFDRLVRYRNRELGHGAAGQRSSEFYDTMGRALLAGTAEMLGRLDVLAGQQLVFVDDVSRQTSGHWSVERYVLQGESARRLDPLQWPRTETASLPHPKQVYLEQHSTVAGAVPLTSLYPLMLYDPAAGEVLYFNGRGRRRNDYLCYTSGQVVSPTDEGGQQHELVARLLDMPVDATPGAPAGGEPRTDEGSSDSPAGEAEHPGRRTIGDFELVSRLGEGGMGIVYRAWQPLLGRAVALKCLMRSGDKAEERFAREIRALGRVQHPHLIKVFTSGSYGDQWFYAMELIEGATLGAICDKLQISTTSASDVSLATWHSTVSTVCEETRQAERLLVPDETEYRPSGPAARATMESPLSPVAGTGSYVRQVVELVRQTAEATHALHEAGIVHRDIKPGNIMVHADGSRAVLMDLGLAQWVDQTSGKLTKTRQFVGTLRYASSEQVLAVGNVDRRSDVYSLGATLWELLTLQPMFGADENTPTPELMRRIQYSEPGLIRPHNPHVPAALEAVVAHALEKDPDQRYATAQELADDLHRWLNDEPVRAQKVSLVYRARKSIRKHRKLLAGVACLALLQAALVLGFYHFGGSRWGNDINAHLDLGGRPPELLRPTSPQSAAMATLPATVPADAGTGRALLVGCTVYDRPQMSLTAPANDVALMRRLLTQRFGFRDDDIVTLEESAGDNTHRPTQSNIRLEIEKLAAAAHRGDQVVILFSGNGARVPASVIPARPQGPPPWETTGAAAFEAAFLPCDVGPQNAAHPRPTNMIGSRDYAEWIKPISERGASLWTIYDACYGGFGYANVPGQVFTYASLPEEETPERPALAGDSHSQPYGLFTYSLCQALLQNKFPLSYGELIQRVHAQYLTQGRTYPTPLAVGADAGHLVFEGKRGFGAQEIRAMRHDDGRLLVNAGSLQGVSPGMILAFKPVDGTAPAPVLGYVRVERVSDESARVVPCAYAGMSVPSDLPEFGHCEPVYVDYGDLRLVVYVARPEPKSLDPASNALFDLLDVQLQSAAHQPRAVFRLSDSPPEAGWIIRRAKGRFCLLPADVARSTPPGDEPAGVSEFILDGEPNVLGCLNRIYRAQNLLKLASSFAEQGGLADVDFKIEMLKLRDRTDQEGEPLSLQDRQGLTSREKGVGVELSPGDFVAWQVTNTGKEPVDVTLLFVDGQLAITPLFPSAAATGVDNRLPPGKSLLTRAARVTDITLGYEHVVAIGVRGQGQFVDFRTLAEANLKQAREHEIGLRGDGERVFDSPLGRLMQYALYSEGTTTGRGLETDQAHEEAMRLISWRVRGPVPAEAR